MRTLAAFEGVSTEMGTASYRRNLMFDNLTS